MVTLASDRPIIVISAGTGADVGRYVITAEHRDGCAVLGTYATLVRARADMARLRRLMRDARRLRGGVGGDGNGGAT